MGASSAIESILAMEGMKRDVLLPTINYEADDEIEIDCVQEGADFRCTCLQNSVSQQTFVSPTVCSQTVDQARATANTGCGYDIPG